MNEAKIGQILVPPLSSGREVSGPPRRLRGIPQHAHCVHPGRHESDPPCSSAHCSAQPTKNDIAPVVCASRKASSKVASGRFTKSVCST